MIYPFQRVGGFDVRNQMDTMAAKMTGKIRNVTCVMQELGYVSVYQSITTDIHFFFIIILKQTSSNT